MARFGQVRFNNLHQVLSSIPTTPSASTRHGYLADKDGPKAPDRVPREPERIPRVPERIPRVPDRVTLFW